MSEIDEVSAGRRRAALTLHALATPDREWLLEQLPAAERGALRGLLVELQDLGIPADADVIRSALAEVTPAAGSALLHPRGHAQVLAREADAFRGVLLSLVAPAQREAMLAHWPLTLEAPPGPAAQPSWAPRLKDAVLDSWQGLAATEEALP
jgi:hypothetical protein